MGNDTSHDLPFLSPLLQHTTESFFPFSPTFYNLSTCFLENEISPQRGGGRRGRKAFIRIQVFLIPHCYVVRRKEGTKGNAIRGK